MRRTLVISALCALAFAASCSSDESTPTNPGTGAAGSSNVIVAAGADSQGSGDVAGASSTGVGGAPIGVAGADSSGVAGRANEVGGSSPAGAGALGSAGAVGFGACNIPRCLVTLMGACMPAGTCVQQSTGALGAGAVCYANGVKTSSSIDAQTMKLSRIVTNGGVACYTIDLALGGGAPAPMTFRDSAGNIVAEGTVDLATQTATVACTGEQSVALNSACNDVVLTATSSCTTGACTP